MLSMLRWRPARPSDDVLLLTFGVKGLVGILEVSCQGASLIRIRDLRMRGI